MGGASAAVAGAGRRRASAAGGWGGPGGLRGGQDRLAPGRPRRLRPRAGFEAFFAALYAHFETAEAWQVYADVLPLLATLSERGCRAGVITNFDGRVVPLLRHLGLADRFDSVTLSSRVGAAKPDPAIFRHALARHGVRPDEALHVGDSPAEDVAGARAAGLFAVLVDREGRHADPARGVRVASLTEVTRFL